jgi:hypothetical protein
MLIKIDLVAEKAGITNLLKKGNVRYNFCELIGILFYWFIMLLAFMAALNALGLTATAQMLDRIILYIPSVIAALFVFILGLFIASFVSGVVRTATAGVGVTESNFLGRLAQTVVTIFALVIALQQLNIKVAVLTYSLNILLASAGLGLALAFGLGGKDAASRMIEDWKEKTRSKTPV